MRVKYDDLASRGLSYINLPIFGFYHVNQAPVTLLFYSVSPHLKEAINPYPSLLSLELVDPPPVPKLRSPANNRGFSIVRADPHPTSACELVCLK